MSLPKPKKQTRQLLSVQDPTRRSHFVHAANAGSSSQRFEAFQGWVLNKSQQCLEPSSLVLACLVSFDGLVTDVSARSAYLACESAATDGKALRIDWLDGLRTDARHLAGPTTLALKQIKVLAPFDVARDGLIAWVQARPICDADAVTSTPTWERLLNWGLSWSQSHLPPIFYGHVSSLAVMSALPRSALARSAKRLALQPEVNVPDSDIRIAPCIYEHAFEAAMLGRSPTALSGSAFIKKLTDALRPPATGSLFARRNAILESLGLLAAEVDQLDETCALLYIFSVDLVENGTRRKNRLAPSTPYDYIKSFALSFHTESAGLRLSDIDPERYAKLFETLLGSLKAASYLVAGLKAFHIFLRAWWSVPQLPTRVFQVDLDARVAANVLWRHELELLQGWIQQASPARFMAQLRAVFAISGYSMIRVSELRLLKLLNLVDEEQQLCIEIARSISDGREKSREGRRRVFIRDESAVSELRRWRTRRIEEGASPNDYVFGDPGNSQRLAEFGKTYFWMNCLVKGASGDQSLSVHSLRHSYASFRFEQIARDAIESEINPMDALANEAGHAGAHVTVSNYCHIFEAELRRSLDQCLISLPLEYPSTASWTGLTQASLRQRVSRQHRAHVTRSNTLWNAIDGCAPRQRWIDISEKCPLGPAVNNLATLNPKGLTYLQVAGLLSDISRGLTISQTSLRQDLPEPLVIAALKLVGDFSQQHGAHDSQLLDELSLGAMALRQTNGRWLGFKPDFSRLRQRRWAGLIRSIEASDDWTLSEATHYWGRALSREHLAVRPGPGWDRFLVLLQGADLNASLISLRWSRTSSSEVEVADALDKAQVAVRVAFGRSVRQIEQPTRGGRPSICLAICGDTRLIDVHGSAHSLIGLHCCMLATVVWQSMNADLNRNNK